MKNYLKKFLIVLMLASGTLQANDNNRFYTWSHWWFNFNRHAMLLVTPLASLAKNIYFHQRTIPQLPDASSSIVQFCSEKLQQHGLNPQDITIKIRTECDLMEAFPGALLFNPSVAEQLDKALNAPANEESIRIIRICTVFLDHEIGHLKNNDIPKRLAALTGVVLTTYLTTSYLIKLFQLEPWFQEPKNLKEFFTSLGSYTLFAGVNNVINQKLFNWYNQYQEDNADAYAISCAKEPASLRTTADFFERLSNNIVEVMCGTLEINPNLPLAQKMYLQVMKAMITKLYESEKPEEDLRTWLKKQNDLLGDMNDMIDPAHPNALLRAQKMRAAADVLERTQKEA